MSCLQQCLRRVWTQNLLGFEEEEPEEKEPEEEEPEEEEPEEEEEEEIELKLNWNWLYSAEQKKQLTHLCPAPSLNRQRTEHDQNLL